jgi:hypothetical protein
MKAFIPNLEEKLRSHDIAPEYFQEFRDLVEHGKSPSTELRRRLRRVVNYKAALDSLLAELSRPVLQRHFPPKVQHFEPLKEAV